MTLAELLKLVNGISANPEINFAQYGEYKVSIPHYGEDRIFLQKGDKVIIFKLDETKS